MAYKNFTNSYKLEVGINNVPSYQASGRPYASGSINAKGRGGAIKIDFPFVTRWVQIYNHGTVDLRVGFSAAGTEGDNYFRVAKPAAGDTAVSARLELKVSELWLSGSDSVDVVAGLTTIRSDRTDTLSGSSWSGSVGVG
tara:strand:+ start:435 stop:854 length:420 start_codon:yes stop_codon:yes gene_type:complete